jgi:hypothetical protein
MSERDDYAEPSTTIRAPWWGLILLALLLFLLGIGGAFAWFWVRDQFAE